MATENDNGRVYLRDLMKLQEKMHQQQKDIQKDITALKVQVAKNTVLTSAIVSVACSIAVVLLTNFLI